jgi:DNA polymerase delta subunit 1
VLEKMTQDMAGLKKNNSEKDQEWARPSLANFKPQVDKLCFQQIEAEEGILNGRAAVKLFGVTEVSSAAEESCHKLTSYCRPAIL